MGSPSSKNRGGPETPVLAPYRSGEKQTSGYGETMLQETGLERAVTLELRRDDPFEGVRSSRPEDARYALHGLLGEGGMGEVRSCTDLHIGREVALKAMRPAQMARADLRARFLREARIQGQLEHPAIVPVYDLAFAEEGALYFTMRRVRGVTLELLVERLRQGDPRTVADYPLRKLLSAFSRVCLAIDFAHTKGVIHRDLKPANIMLGDFGEVYVLDWGVAKLLSNEAPASQQATDLAISKLDFTDVASAKTASGAIIGTPGYMAPEQILGQSGEVNAQTDVFALGTILFELLTYESLFGEGDTPDILARTLRGEGRSASARCPDRVIPGALDAVCMRATSPYPEKRYASARDFSEAIEAFLSGDLDLERRQAAARGHASLARELAGRALAATGTPEERQGALREVGRSLALDPDDPEALALLVRLVTAPPASLPAEVVDEVRAFDGHRGDRAARRGSLLFALGALFFVFPTALLMGVRNPTSVAVNLILWGLAPALLFLGRRLPMWVAPIVTYAAVASTSLIFGPFISVPGIAAVVTVAFVLSGRRAHRLLASGLAVVSLVLPLALEFAGVLPRSFILEKDRFVILLNAVETPSLTTVLLLAATHVATVLFVANYVAEGKDALDRAEVQNRLQAWQLRQLVPPEAQGALKSHGRTPPSERGLPPRRAVGDTSKSRS